VVHVSTAEIGGAEASLLDALARLPGRPFFLVPGEGPLTRALESRGWRWKALPWPGGMRLLTQRNLLALPLVLPGLPAYLLRLWMELRGAPAVLSSGFKSHAACLPLSPFLGPRLRFDVRDFLKPVRARGLIARAARLFGCKVTANSAAVAVDYPGAEVIYPVVRLARPAARRHPGERRIITHLAYFAPYKGQDLFLSLARRLLDKGLDAEFWLAGDVIYPAAAYARYRDDVYALAAKLGLASRVRFLGRVPGAEAVQDVLEQTDLLLHCTREPVPFGRSLLEALLCGCEAVCHKGSGVCEVTAPSRTFPGWMEPFGKVLGEEFVRVSLKSSP
jgi:glycosyltransferase involved in cell wall biosynthesis